MADEILKQTEGAIEELVENISSEIIEQSAEEIASQGEINFKELYAAATKFKGKIDKAKEIRNPSHLETIDSTVLDSIRESYSEMAIFAKAVDKFFGRETFYIIVDRDGKNFEETLFTFDEVEAFANLNSNWKFNKDSLKTLNKAIEEKEIVEEVVQNLKNNYIHISPIYQEVLRRHEIAMDVTRQRKKQKNPEKKYATGTGYLMWKQTGRGMAGSTSDIKIVPRRGAIWELGKLQQAGDISEGYVDALTHEPDKIYPPLPIDMEYGVKALFVYYIAKVDNMAALFGADIQNIQNSIVQFAVKTTNGLPPAISQYIVFADMVLDWKEENNYENIQRRVEQKAAGFENFKTSSSSNNIKRNQIIREKLVKPIIQETIEEVIDRIEGVFST